MAKQKKKTHHSRSNKGGIMVRSDIPYAQRLNMQHRNDIYVSRDHAAKIAMYCLSYAMNELEGIGYKRLLRFNFHFHEVVDEFYEDPDLGMAHAKRRMEQMGMPISGDFYSYKIKGLSKKTQEVHDNSMQAAQVALICGAIAMNDVFGFGTERQLRISERANELSAKYAREGDKFLLDKMEEIGFLIEDGRVVTYLDENGNPIGPRRPPRKKKDSTEAWRKEAE